MCNIGGPPSVNLLREILSLVSILNTSFSFTLPVILITGLAVAYTLILYARSQQGQHRLHKINSRALSLRELSLMSSHAVSSLVLAVIAYLALG